MADRLEGPSEDAERREAEPHLPSPSVAPFLFALGVALVLIGLVIASWLIVAIGALIAVVFAFFWIRDATREVRGGAEPAPPGARPAAVAVEEEDEDEPARYPRSVFLEGATLGIGAAIGGVVTLPALGFAVLPAFVGQDYESVDVGPLENFPEGEWIVTKFRSVENEPEDVSRRTAYIRNNGVQNGTPSFTIISNRCVHLGCPVRPQGLTEEPQKVETKTGNVELAKTAPSGFGCPCHGGAYDIEGNRTAGPPVRALDRYTYSIRDGSLVLGQPYSVAKVRGTGADARMEAYDIADPGVHVNGPEQFFYPYVP
ncbi:MAG: Rieske 2Fe-2S domain-containing protein [Thermoleophilia bacterium]|nr:Rieske 2Fe-2S domain-containing protein [Thermoleophilia bacterium]